MKGCFIYGRFSADYGYLSEMKKAEFEKKFERVIDVKQAWVKLQTELKGFKDEAKKK